MEKNTTAYILDYADIHPNFSIEDLLSYLGKKISISRSALSWYLFKLVNDNKLVRTGHGIYSKITKQMFAPEPIEKVREVNGLLQKHYPFARFCVYQGEILAPLQHHLSSNRVIYIETDRDSAETVFNFLRETKTDVFLRPDKEMIYRYIDLAKRVYIVKNLVSEAPLQKVSGVPMPTLEKMLVDILRDPDFFYLQGSESEHIIENAFNLYTINNNRLFRYAGRRKVIDGLRTILNNITTK
ncbi:MAG: DUF6577 family protein [Prevotella sp.]|uniref:DUF6577 family protein n=1 Tax=Prevotella sp. TaxID=59823 RepID=UPI002A8363FA|nr:DUF6577 family protein [Prevotella sp.]MDY4020085.1 DUF6577 family protein [Prevotella sp.]MDY6130163.1 DUF6577 family protein [Prevotella sp.]